MRILTLALPVILFAVPAPAAEITVLAGMGVISGVSDLAPAYEKLTGHSVVVRFEPTAAMNQKINAGAQADIAALQPEQIDNLIKQGKMVAGTKTNFAQAGVGVAVKAGAARPDISTIEAFSRWPSSISSPPHSSANWLDPHPLPQRGGEEFAASPSL